MILNPTQSCTYSCTQPIYDDGSPTKMQLYGSHAVKTSCEMSKSHRAGNQLCNARGVSALDIRPLLLDRDYTRRRVHGDKKCWDRWRKSRLYDEICTLTATCRTWNGRDGSEPGQAAADGVVRLPTRPDPTHSCPAHSTPLHLPATLHELLPADGNIYTARSQYHTREDAGCESSVPTNGLSPKQHSYEKLTQSHR